MIGPGAEHPRIEPRGFARVGLETKTLQQIRFGGSGAVARFRLGVVFHGERVVRFGSSSGTIAPPFKNPLSVSTLAGLDLLAFLGAILLGFRADLDGDEHGGGDGQIVAFAFEHEADFHALRMRLADFKKPRSCWLKRASAMKVAAGITSSSHGPAGAIQSAGRPVLMPLTAVGESWLTRFSREHACRPPSSSCTSVWLARPLASATKIFTPHGDAGVEDDPLIVRALFRQLLQIARQLRWIWSFAWLALRKLECAEAVEILFQRGCARLEAEAQQQRRVLFCADDDFSDRRAFEREQLGFVFRRGHRRARGAGAVFIQCDDDRRRRRCGRGRFPLSTRPRAA